MPRVTPFRDPLYPSWAIVPQVVGVREGQSVVVRKWIRDDGIEVLPKGGLYVAEDFEPAPLDELLERIELEIPLRHDEPEKDWLWRQIGKGRRYALPHQVLVDLYVIWVEEIGGSQTQFCRDVGEKKRRDVKHMLQGRPDTGITWDRAVQWATNLSVRLLTAGKEPVTFTFNPLAPRAARCLLNGPGGSIEHYYGKWAGRNPKALERMGWSRRLLKHFDPGIDSFLKASRVAHALTKPVDVEVESLTDIAAILWLASGLTLGGWHDAIGLDVDIGPAIRGEDEPLTESEVRDINIASYRNLRGLRAAWREKGGRFHVQIKPGRPLRSPAWLAPPDNAG